MPQYNSLIAVSAGRNNIDTGTSDCFDAREIANMRAKGFSAVRLGPRVLRTETAAMAGLAVLQSLWGDWQ